MSITYGYIFYTLRKRLRAIQLQEMAGGQFLGFGADVGNITTSAIETVIGSLYFMLKYIFNVIFKQNRRGCKKSIYDQLGKAFTSQN